MKKILFLVSCGVFLFKSYGAYPKHWWQPVDRDSAPSWEILPQDAKKGEVILSKRNELGIFSNLAQSPFILDGIRYQSVEGLWQGIKYPDPELKDDPRFNYKEWPHTREEVFSFSMWDSKYAGNKANKILAEIGINWVNYQDHKFNYVDGKEGSAFHLELITRAIREKVNQNPDIKDLLLKTKGLKLLPDHHQSEDSPPSFFYHKILMKIRDTEL